jgi:protein SCO1/2
MTWFNVLTSIMFLAESGGSAARLAVIQPAPNFSLTNQAGKPFGMADVKDKVRLVSFIFTTCNGTCPATTHRMCQIQESLSTAGLSKKGDVRLLSITLDPKRDTPEVLRNYMRLYDIDSNGWTFLTGDPAQVDKVVAAWGMWARPAANGQLDHPSRVFLVDKRGRIREIYDLTFLKPAWVVEDIRALLNE